MVANMTIREERDWTEWFREAFGKNPTLADYGNAAFEGRTKEYREAAARSYARLFVSPYGELDPDAGKYMPIEFREDFRIESPFFQEWEEKARKTDLKKNAVYMRWYEKTLPEREAYKKVALKEKRIKHYMLAEKYKADNMMHMRSLAKQWTNLYDNKVLTIAQNEYFAAKFMDIIKKDPTTKAYLPDTIVNMPGSKVATPFYDEVMKFINEDKEGYEGFFAIKGDLRGIAMLQLKKDAEQDQYFRKHPKEAKAHADAIKRRLANVERAYEKYYVSPPLGETAKDSAPPQTKDVAR
jgi:hypothetical protein